MCLDRTRLESGDVCNGEKCHTIGCWTDFHYLHETLDSPRTKFISDSWFCSKFAKMERIMWPVSWAEGPRKGAIRGAFTPRTRHSTCFSNVCQSYHQTSHKPQKSDSHARWAHPYPLDAWCSESRRRRCFVLLDVQALSGQHTLRLLKYIDRMAHLIKWLNNIVFEFLLRESDGTFSSNDWTAQRTTQSSNRYLEKQMAHSYRMIERHSKQHSDESLLRESKRISWSNDWTTQ